MSILYLIYGMVNMYRYKSIMHIRLAPSCKLKARLLTVLLLIFSGILTSFCLSEAYHIVVINGIPVPMDSDFRSDGSDFQMNSSAGLFTEEDAITQHIHSSLTDGDHVIYMHVSSRRILLVLLNTNNEKYFRIIQYEPEADECHIVNSPVLPKQTVFDFFHCGDSVIAEIPFFDGNHDFQAPDWLMMTFCETEPFRWVLKHYSDGYTFLAENTDGKGNFCFNDLNWPDDEFEWQVNLDCSLDSINCTELKAVAELYNSTISNRPSLKDELIDTW